MFVILTSGSLYLAKVVAVSGMSFEIREGVVLSRQESTDTNQWRDQREGQDTGLRSKGFDPFLFGEVRCRVGFTHQSGMD